MARYKSTCYNPVFENIRKESKSMNRDAKKSEFMFEKFDFPDTEGVVVDAAAVEGEEVKENEELDKGNESMKND